MVLIWLGNGRQRAKREGERKRQRGRFGEVVEGKSGKGWMEGKTSRHAMKAYILKCR